MIHINRIDDTNIYEFEINNSSETTDVKRLLEFVVQKEEKNDSVKMMVEIKNIAAYSNVRKDAQRLISKYTQVKIISACVLLTDFEWLKDLLPIGEFFKDNLKVKHFKVSERYKAINWLKEN